MIPGGAPAFRVVSCPAPSHGPWCELSATPPASPEGSSGRLPVQRGREGAGPSGSLFSNGSLVPLRRALSPGATPHRSQHRAQTSVLGGDSLGRGDEPVEEMNSAPLHPSRSGSFGLVPGSAACWRWA